MSNSCERTSFWQNVCAGSVSAMSAVAFIQPMLYFKNVKQAQASVSPNPRVWYRGVRVFAGSFVPTTAIQTAANGVF
ncbi:MAG: hypothetical protein S4CHLAM2_14880 [Chlamydiales bacterium]|nr:hypothetical protein [Chlamydiales bacterium]